MRASEGAHPVLVAADSGLGRVLWLGLDPLRSTIRSWSGHGAFWTVVLRAALREEPRGTRLRELDTLNAASESARVLPRLPAPSRPALAGFASLYALIFGPLNIWVLRRLRRTVRAWLFVPALSVAMTGVLLAVGHAWGRGYALLNRVTVIETISGARTAREQELIGLFSPTNRTFDLVSPDRSARLIRVDSAEEDVSRTSIRWGRAAPREMVPTLQSEAGARWVRVPFVLWSLQEFRCERIVDLGGTVTVQLTPEFSGWVRNDTPLRLEECRLVRGNEQCDLGTLPAGARAAVRAGDWRQRRWEARLADNAYGAYGSPQPAGRLPDSDRAFTLQEEAALMLSRDGTGKATGGEGVLVARCPPLPLRPRVLGLSGYDRAHLLLVRVPLPAGAGRGASGATSGRPGFRIAPAGAGNKPSSRGPRL